MTKSANKAVKVEGTSIDALVKEGKALGKMWSTLNNVKQSTKANGFDTRLGKLLSTLKAQSALDSGQIPTHVLRTHGIHNIDRRRRSEALWFYENQAECVEFIKQSRKGFTSLTALQRAMKQAAKAEAVEAPKPAKAEVSNVGQSDGLVSDTGWIETVKLRFQCLLLALQLWIQLWSSAHKMALTLRSLLPIYSHVLLCKLRRRHKNVW